MNKFRYLSINKMNLLPKGPGVYCFKNKEILYIGKAANLEKRIKNHFRNPSYKDQLFLEKIKKIGHIQTDSEIEALILEANLIRRYQPRFNVIWRDDKNYFFVGISREDFPQIFVTHQPKPQTKYVGPFVDGKALKQALKLLRGAFRYRSCRVLPKKPCLFYHLEKCSAPCANKVNKKDYLADIKNLIEILKGQKKSVINYLKKEMQKIAQTQEFERAAKIRDKISILKNIFEHQRFLKLPESSEKINWSKTQEELKKLLNPEGNIKKIEAYDISNIQGQQATGSMVIFIEGKPDKKQYRRFKIRITGKPNDTAMIKEVLTRRFNHPEWPHPDLILIDGGIAQLNVAVNSKWGSSKAWEGGGRAGVQNPNSKKIKVIALAKKHNELYIEGQKQSVLLKSLPRGIFNLILQLRDEAHRFAISYHRKLRKKALVDPVRSLPMYSLVGKIHN